MRADNREESVDAVDRIGQVVADAVGAELARQMPKFSAEIAKAVERQIDRRHEVRRRLTPREPGWPGPEAVVIIDERCNRRTPVGGASHSRTSSRLSRWRKGVWAPLHHVEDTIQAFGGDFTNLPEPIDPECEP